MPQASVRRTFDRYLDAARKRDAADALDVYTPYEIRNLLTCAHLNQPRHVDALLTNFMRHRRPAA